MGRKKFSKIDDSVVVLASAEDRILLSSYTWSRNGNIIVASGNDNYIHMSRVIMSAMGHSVRGSSTVEFLDGNCFNHVRSNVVKCCRVVKKSNYTGVICRQREIFQTHIREGSKFFYFGSYKSEIEAAVAVLAGTTYLSRRKLRKVIDRPYAVRELGEERVFEIEAKVLYKTPADQFKDLFNLPPIS